MIYSVTVTASTRAYERRKSMEVDAPTPGDAIAGVIALMRLEMGETVTAEAVLVAEEGCDEDGPGDDGGARARPGEALLG